MELFYRESGESAPLIILHGLFGISDNWSSVAKQLAADFRVILPDLRNHGQSPHSSDFSYSLMAEDLKELADKLNLDKFYLVGHSMGGKVAMEFACLYPERVSKLVVVDISPRYYPPHHQEILEAMFSLDFDVLKTRKQADEKLSEKMSDYGLRQFLLKNIYWEGSERLNWRMNLPVLSEKVEEVGKALPENYIFHGPTLFIKGEKSGYIKDADQELILKHFPNADFSTVIDAGHWVHAENPSEFLKVLEEFLG